jgi:hypothetical protein
VVLSKREKYIAMATIGLVVALGIYYIMIDPYLDRSEELKNEQTVANKTLVDNDNLLLLQAKKQSDWNVMLKNGLEADYSTAQSRTQQMLQNWARESGINIENVSSEPVPAQKGQFQVINFNLDFNTEGDQAMRHIARFLWSIESAAIPIRLNDVRLQSTREGTDQLSVKLIVSALYMPPTGQTTPNGGDIFNEFEGMQ